MSKTKPITLTYRCLVIYRFILAFVVGFICTAFLSIALSYLFNMTLPKAESIYLAAFCSILFYTIFVIMTFCIRSVVRLTIYNAMICGLCLCLMMVLG